MHVSSELSRLSHLGCLDSLSLDPQIARFPALWTMSIGSGTCFMTQTRKCQVKNLVDVASPCLDLLISLTGHGGLFQVDADSARAVTLDWWIWR